MTSILKVDNIQNSSGTAAMTIDGSSNVTFPQNATFNGTVTGTGIVKAATVSPSGTAACDFTSIPAGVVRISLSGSGVSQTGGSGVPNSYFMIKIGDSGGFESTGYSGAIWQQNSAGTDGAAKAQSSGTGTNGNGWAVTLATSASTVLNITAELRLVDASTNTWIYNFISTTDTTGIFAGAGSKSLSGTLDRVRLQTYSSFNFDAGKVSIQYE